LECTLLCFCIRFLPSYVFLLKCVLLCCTLQQTHLRRLESDTKSEQYTLQQQHIRRQESDTKTEQYTRQQKHIRGQESDTKTEQYTLQQNT
jgi:hypothetical protein